MSNTLFKKIGLLIFAVGLGGSQTANAQWWVSDVVFNLNTCGTSCGGWGHPFNAAVIARMQCEGYALVAQTRNYRTVGEAQTGSSEYEKVSFSRAADPEIISTTGSWPNWQVCHGVNLSHPDECTNFSSLTTGWRGYPPAVLPNAPLDRVYYTMTTSHVPLGTHWWVFKTTMNAQHCNEMRWVKQMTLTP